MSKSREHKKHKKRELRASQRGPVPLFKEGQFPTLTEMPKHLTLNEVYGWQPCSDEDRISHLTRRLCELYQTPFADIDSEDICFLLRHHIGVEVFIEQALAWLEQDPLADMQYYHGDLLITVLDLDAKHLMSANRVVRLTAIAERALSDPRSRDGIEYPGFEETRAQIAVRLDARADSDPRRRARRGPLAGRGRGDMR
jgi:hypothetical protein